jgi:putative ABC transport system ATP-binding protein
MLNLEGITKSFDQHSGQQVLHRVSLQLAAGEYIAIMGESGVGKSTLLNLIAGLDTPDSGRVLFEGQDLALLSDAARTRWRRATLGFVFQAFHLLPHLSVERNIALPLALNRAAPAVLAQRVEELLRAVGLLERRHAPPSKLSGGEMQRVAVARALAHRPRLVLADEPTGNLDAQSAQQVLNLLSEQLRRDRAAGILVTHSALAAASAERIYVLSARGLELRPPVVTRQAV